LSHRLEPAGHAEVDGLYIRGQSRRWFVLRHTGRKGGHTPLLQAGAETSDNGAEAVKPDPGSSWEGHSGGVGAAVGIENAESSGVVRPLRVPLVIFPLGRTYVVVR